MKAANIALSFVPVSGEVPGGSVSCDEAWRGCECGLVGEKEYTLELETFVDEGSIVQDITFKCVSCGLYADLKDYLYAGGNVYTPVGIPVKVSWKVSKLHNAYDDPELTGEVSV